jgi:DNA-binding NarL/FixJ family response regulator
MSDLNQQSQIRLVVLGERGLFCAGLSRVVASEPGFEVMGECNTPAEALEVLRGSPIDLILLDFAIGAEEVNRFIVTARQSGYVGQFLIVSEMLDARKSAFVLSLGASGIFLKTESPARLAEAIRFIAHGDSWVDPRIIELIAGHLIERLPAEGQQRRPSLESREQAVLSAVIEGSSNRAIGDHMGLAEGSVKNIVQHLLRKAGVKNRSQLVRAVMGGTLQTQEAGTASRATARRGTRNTPPRPAEDQPRRPSLGSREQAVLSGILEGFSNRTIGDQMGLSEGSIKNIVQRLFRKAGVKNRSQLVRAALGGTLETQEPGTASRATARRGTGNRPPRPASNLDTSGRLEMPAFPKRLS